MVATIAALVPVAAAEDWESSERDVPVTTDHGLAVTASVPEVVYKTAPFEIVAVVDNPTDEAVELTVFHGDALHPAFDTSIRKEGSSGDHMVLLPVMPEGVAVYHRFDGKQGRYAYTVPARGSLSFRGQVDWRNYPDRIDRVDAGRYRLLLDFSYWLGDHTSPAPLKLDPATNEMRTDLSSREQHMVRWHLPIEVRDSET